MIKMSQSAPEKLDRQKKKKIDFDHKSVLGIGSYTLASVVLLDHHFLIGGIQCKIKVAEHSF